MITVLHFLHCDTCGTTGPKLDLGTKGAPQQLREVEHTGCEGELLLRHEVVNIPGRLDVGSAA